MYSSTCGVPFPLETNPVIKPGRSASLKICHRPFSRDQRLVVGADQDSSRPDGARPAPGHQAWLAMGPTLHLDRAAPAKSPSSGNSRNADHSPACRSCRPVRRDRRGRTASSRWDRTARRRHIPRAQKRATLVVTNLADSGLTIGNGAAVTAGEAAYPVAVKFFVKSPSWTFS